MSRLAVFFLLVISPMLAMLLPSLVYRTKVEEKLLTGAKAMT